MCEVSDLCEGIIVYPLLDNGTTCGIDGDRFEEMAINGVPLIRLVPGPASLAEIMYIIHSDIQPETRCVYFYPIRFLSLSPPQKIKPDTSYRTDMFGFKTSDKNWDRGLNLV